MGGLYNPKYTSIEDVKMELYGKVMFSNEDQDYISDNFVYDKIAKGEALVELELSRIYRVPFVGLDLEPFHEISDEFYSSKQYISSVALFQACIFIMDSFFSRSEGVRGEYSRQNYIDRIDQFKSAIIDKDVQISYYWKNPPLKGLRLNEEASYANAALPSPVNAVIGANDYNKQAIQRKLTNPNSNWWTTNTPW